MLSNLNIIKNIRDIESISIINKTGNNIDNKSNNKNRARIFTRFDVKMEEAFCLKVRR